MRKFIQLAAVAAVAAAQHAAAQQAPLSLMAIGDWGGDNDQQPANAAEIAAAKGMSAKATELAASAVLLLGDNFYLHGVSSSSSSRFNQTFENVYSPDMFGKLPFYVVAGNHDHRGSVQAQIDYSARSARWNFPSLYYSLPFEFTSSSGVARKLELLMIDTVVLTGISDDECVGCELPGPPSVEAAEAQWAWLEGRLNASTADFLWVGGHYPIYSAGQDGTTALLVKRLLPLLQAHGAHYIGGHDHMFEHIVADGVNMVVTGPGRECCYPAKKLHTVPDGAIQYMITGRGGQGPSVGTKPATEMLSGFSSLQFDDHATCTLYKEDGTALYATPPIAARSAVPGSGHEASPSPTVEAAVEATLETLAAEELVETSAASSSSSSSSSDGMECWMCKKLLPHVKTHECKDKCSSWWHWTQAACRDVCVELLKVCVDLGDKCEDLACSTAGYC